MQGKAARPAPCSPHCSSHAAAHRCYVPDARLFVAIERDGVDQVDHMHPPLVGVEEHLR
jgi:hypothetical protein